MRKLLHNIQPSSEKQRIGNPQKTMEESPSQTSNSSAFDIPEDQGYAMTDIKTCAAIEFLLTKLEPVNLSDLSPDAQKCAICHEKFHISTDLTLAHTPVKTTCGHIFGHKCITKHLDPLCFYTHNEPATPPSGPLFRTCNARCPTCTHSFYAAPHQQPLQTLRIRLWVWDMAYASAEVRRSAAETRSRASLWAYVRYCERFEDVSLHPRTPYDLELDALLLLKRFTLTLHTTKLTPEQHAKRIRLERVVDRGVDEYERAMARLFG